MTTYRWIPWFLGNSRDLTDFNDRLNWSQDLPNGGAEIPAGATPGSGDIALFGFPPAAFAGSGMPSGQINGNATTQELSFQQGTNPPPSGWFLNGQQTTGTLDVVNSAVTISAGATVSAQQVTLETAAAQISVGGYLLASSLTAAVGGGVTIAATGTLELGLLASNIAATFQGGDGTLTVDAERGSPTISVTGFVSGDTMDFSGLANLTMPAAYGNTGEVDVYSAQAGLNSSPIAVLVLSTDALANTVEPQADGRGGTDLVLDPVAAGPQDPLSDQYATGIVWSVIDANEGSVYLNPYVPAYNITSSGVTVGVGVDLGRRSTAAITALFNSAFGSGWTNDPNLVFLSNAGNNKTGVNAAAYLETKPADIVTVTNSSVYSTSVSITSEQANALTMVVEQGSLDTLASAYTSAAAAKSLGGWNSITGDQKTAIFDAAYNVGVGGAETRSTFWSDVTSQNWAAAAKSIMKINMSSPTRAAADAKLLLNGAQAPVSVQTGSFDGSFLDYLFPVPDTSTLFDFDPTGTSFTLLEMPGSPSIASLDLPDGLASEFSVSWHLPNGWSSPVVVSSGGEETLPANVDGLQVDLLDSSGNPVTDAADFQFLVTFATTGTVEADITATTACFARGTRILAMTGAVPVEDLAAGCTLTCCDGLSREVVWIGRRSVDCRRHPRPRDVWPILIRRNAFGSGEPSNDLYLSPDHSVFVDGVLIPVRHLVNGATIVQEPRDEVTYYHVELERHAIIFAEGLPCESYLDTGNRCAFQNGGPSVHLHPDFAMKIWKTKACAEIIWEGVELECARSWLLHRAREMGHILINDPRLLLLVGDEVVRPDVVETTYRFKIPASSRNAYLFSRSSVPSEVLAGSTDHRRLGVAISALEIDGAELSLGDDIFGSGWHDVETGADGSRWRWTDGLGELVVGDGSVVVITVTMAGPYWLENDSREENDRRPARPVRLA